eukprot:TRINITY_DN14791_c1_g1_i8.p1 TRINITY_DN14791_c1_g1~~TRINITY_DN14791_c1_g1_i8.p1  ORF type:complete len:197 (-),score=16.62 TRINITY_DN14791_c1_g1_i8:47-607(-)
MSRRDVVRILANPQPPSPPPPPPANDVPSVVHPYLPPEDCQEYPKMGGQDYLREYYRHNLSKCVPRDLPVPTEVVHFIVHCIEESYNIGDRIEVLDKTKRWFVSTVLDVREGEVFVHYNGWSDKWDEWVRTNAETGRIAPLLTHTNGQDFEPNYPPLRPRSPFARQHGAIIAPWRQPMNVPETPPE